MSLLDFHNYVQAKKNDIYTKNIPPYFFERNVLKTFANPSWINNPKKKSITPLIDYNFYELSVNTYHVLLNWPVKVSVTVLTKNNGDNKNKITLNLKEFWINEIPNINPDKLNIHTFKDLLEITHFVGIPITSSFLDRITNSIKENIIHFRASTLVYPQRYTSSYISEDTLNAIVNACKESVDLRAIYGNIAKNENQYLRICPYVWNVRHYDMYNVINSSLFNDWSEYISFLMSQYNHGVGDSRMFILAKEQYIRSTAFTLTWIRDSSITKSIINKPLAEWNNLTTEREKLAYLSQCQLVDHSWYTLSGIYVCCHHEKLLLTGREPPTITSDNNKLCKWCYEIIESNMNDTNVFAEGRIDINEASIINNTGEDDVNILLEQDVVNKRVSRNNSRVLYRLRLVSNKHITTSDISNYEPSMRNVRKVVNKWLQFFKLKLYEELFSTLTKIDVFSQRSIGIAWGRILEHFGITTESRNNQNIEDFVIVLKQYLNSYITTKQTSSRVDRRIFKIIFNSQHIPVHIMYTLGDAYAVAMVDNMDNINFNNLRINQKVLSTPIFFYNHYYTSSLIKDDNFLALINNLYANLNRIFNRTIKIIYADRTISIEDTNLDFDRKVLFNSPYKSNVDYYRLLSYFADCNASSVTVALPNYNILDSMNKIGIIKLIKYVTSLIYSNLIRQQLPNNVIDLTKTILNTIDSSKKLEKKYQQNVYGKNIQALLNTTNIPINEQYNCTELENILRPKCSSKHYKSNKLSNKLNYDGIILDTMNDDNQFKIKNIPTVQYSGKTNSKRVTDFFKGKKYNDTLMNTYSLGIQYMMKLYYWCMNLETDMNANFVMDGFITDCRIKLWTALNQTLSQTNVIPSYALINSTNQSILNKIDLFSKEVASYLQIIDVNMRNDILKWMYEELEWRALSSITPTEYENILINSIKYTNRAIIREEKAKRDDEEDIIIPDVIEDDQYDILMTVEDDADAMDEGIQALYSDDMVIDNEGIY